ncbi:MAG TPA: amino acid transporter [Streptosporangiaceae bacterium]
MARTQTPWGPWEPLSLDRVATIFSAAGVPWWIAGGYAIELAVGRPFREHEDIDVLLLRPDQLAVQDVLPSWQWHAADPPGVLRPWQRGELLPAHVHDIWCRPGPAEPWQVQVMLDEADGARWVSRHSAALRRSASQIGAVSADGVPYLRPEIQLFYKAHKRRPKDELDFTAVIGVLDDDQRRWLSAAISLAYGPHPWLERIAAAG